MGKSTRRRIAVDGHTFLWAVGSANFVVWDVNGRQVARSAPNEVVGVTPDIYERGGWKRTSDGMVRPFDVANWIRVNILGARPIPVRAPVTALAGTPAKKLPRRPVAVAAGQPEAYVLVCEAGEYEDYGMSIIEVHLDPQVAKERVGELNQAQQIGREIAGRILEARRAAGDDFVRRNPGGGASPEYWAALDAAECACLKEHGITDQADREFLSDISPSGVIDRYSVIPVRLLSSIRVPQAV